MALLKISYIYKEIWYVLLIAFDSVINVLHVFYTKRNEENLTDVESNFDNKLL